MLKLILGLVSIGLGAVFGALGTVLVKDGWASISAKPNIAENNSNDSIIDKASPEKVIPKSILGEVDEAKLISLGFTKFERLNFDLWTRIPENQTNTFSEREFLISINEELVALVSVIDIHHECAWQSGQWDRLVYENNSGCDIAKLFSREKYKKRLSAAEHLIFVGMESYLNAPTMTNCDSHANISQCRAHELFIRTSNILDNSGSPRRYWGLHLGQSKIENPELEFDQRRAITIGIKEKIAELPINDIVRKIVLNSQNDNYDLTSYQFSNSAVPLEFEYIDTK